MICCGWGNELHGRISRDSHRKGDQIEKKQMNGVEQVEDIFQPDAPFSVVKGNPGM